MQASLLQQTSAVARRVLREQTRQRRSVVFWAVFPAAMMLLFGSVYSKNAPAGGALDTTPPGILIGAALFFSCLGGTVSLIVTERERRTLRRLLISPLRPAAYFLGVVAAFSAVAAGQTLVVYGIGFAMGARFHGSLAAGAAIVALSVVTYAGLGFALGARFAKRAEDVNGPVAAFGVPLLVLGGTFFPAQLLPDFLLKLAQLDPVFHMNQALKGVSAGTLSGSPLAARLAWLAAFALAALALGVASYRRMLEEEKKA